MACLCQGQVGISNVHSSHQEVAENVMCNAFGLGFIHEMHSVINAARINALLGTV
jgi:hypothetical protein